MDELRVVRTAAGEHRRVEEGQVPGGVGRPDVQQQVIGAVVVLEAGRLENLPRHLVDRRIAVAAERAVSRLAGRGDERGALLVGVRRVGVCETVEALVPLLAAVGARSDEVVVGLVDERRRAGVGGLMRRRRCGVVDREPRTVGAGARATAGEVLRGRRTAVGRRRDAIAGQRVEVDEVLLAAAVERDVRVTAAGWCVEALHRVGDRAGRDRPVRVSSIDGAEPDAALRAGSGRSADEDATLRVDADVRLAERVDRVGDGRRLERDRRGRRRGRPGRDMTATDVQEYARNAGSRQHQCEAGELQHRHHLSFLDVYRRRTAGDRKMSHGDAGAIPREPGSETPDLQGFR